MDRTDVAVVGGGMVGATLALLLAEALPESRVTLLEARPYLDEAASGLPSFDARSTALSPSTAILLKRLGLWEALADYTTPILEIRVSDRGQPGCMRMTTDDNRGAPLGYVVENRGLGRALINAVQARTKLTLLSPASVTALTPRASGVELQRAEGQALHCQLAVIADGADSPLRRMLHIEETVKDYEQYAIVANVGFEKPHQSVAYERFTADGPMALLPLGGAEASFSALVMTCPSSEIDRLRAMSDPAFLAELQTRFGHRLGRFTRISQRHYYPLSLRRAQEQVRSGLVLMGNAAHFLHPVAGQGFNLAVRDCARLADVLHHREPGQPLGHLELLQRYERLQSVDQDRTIFLSDSFNRLFRLPGGAFGWLRSLGFVSLEISETVRDNFIGQLSGRAFARAAPIAPAKP